MKLLSYYKKNICEAGCDEAGRGSLVGPVVAAAVVLDPSKRLIGLNDSKILKESERNKLRIEIENNSLAYGVAFIDHEIIDRINILQASLLAMNQAIRKIQIPIDHVILDGNKSIPHLNINQTCIVKGDGKYESIAAASILAKTYRDEFMLNLHNLYPEYHWHSNKGYASIHHRKTIRAIGYTKYHRKSFKLKELTPDLFSSLELLSANK